MDARLHLRNVVAVLSVSVGGAAMAQDYVWVGSVSPNWFNPQNWNPTQLPTPGSTVLIPTGAPNVQLGSGAEPILASLSAFRTLELSGRLSVTSGTLLNLDFRNTGGSTSPFTVNADLMLTGDSTAWRGGAFMGAGIVTNTGTVTLLNGGAKIIDGVLFRNTGRMIQSGGNLEIRDAAFENSGEFEMGIFPVFPGAGHERSAGFINTGILRKSIGTNTTNFGAPFHNAGTIEAGSGTVSFTGYIQQHADGAAILSSGAVIRIYAAQNVAADPPELGGSVTGAGDYVVQGGPVNVIHPLIADMSADSPRGFVIDATSGSDEVSLDADILNHGSAAFLFGRLAGAGRLMNMPGADLDIGNVSTAGARISQDAGISNAGSASVRGSLVLSDRAVVDNQADGTLYLTLGSISSIGTEARVINAGTLRKETVASSSTGIAADLRLVGASRVAVESRELTFAGPTRWEGSTVVDLGPGTSPSLRLFGSQTVVSDGNVAQGLGSLVIDQMNLPSGSFENRIGPDAGFGATLQGFLMSGAGTFFNNGLLNFNNASIFGYGSDGAIINAGTVICRGGSIIGGSIRNAPTGRFELVTGVLSVSTASVVPNQGTLVFNGGHMTGTGSIISDGLIEKLGPSSTSVGPRLENFGTVHVFAGSLTIADPGNRVGPALVGGTWIVEPGAILNFPPGISTIAPPTTISCSGTSAPWFRDVSSIQGQATVVGPTSMNAPMTVERSATMTLLPDATLNVPVRMVNAPDEKDILSEISQVTVLSWKPPAPAIIVTPVLENRAILVPGGHAAPGSFNLTGTLNCHPTSTLDVELGGFTPIAEHDQFVITGAVHLDGVIRVSRIDGFEPARGDVFSVLTATGAISGAPRRVEFPGLPPHLAGRARVLGSALQVVIACRADFNADAAVNSQDFFDFLNAFFAGIPAADFNADSAVNSQDFFDFLGAFFTAC